jgi:hypothetical protein
MLNFRSLSVASLTVMPESKDHFLQGRQKYRVEKQGDIYEDVSMERGTFLVQQAMRVSD